MTGGRIYFYRDFGWTNRPRDQAHFYIRKYDVNDAHPSCPSHRSRPYMPGKPISWPPHRVLYRSNETNIIKCYNPGSRDNEKWVTYPDSFTSRALTLNHVGCRWIHLIAAVTFIKNNGPTFSLHPLLWYVGERYIWRARGGIVSLQQQEILIWRWPIHRSVSLSLCIIRWLGG